MSNPTTEETGLALANLRIEYEAAPNNVSPESGPRFSWQIGLDRRGAGQTAYRVVVAHDRDALLEEGEPSGTPVASSPTPWPRSRTTAHPFGPTPRTTGG